MTQDFIMLPKVDFVFKELMESAIVRAGFLSAVIGIKISDIKETVLLNTNLRKTSADEKQSILDVRILLNNDHEINIEIQLAYLKSWPERSLFYLSKMFIDQIREGEPYNKLHKCISISILDFKLLKGSDDYYTSFHLRNDRWNTVYSDLFELHVIELPKLKREIVATDDLMMWAMFISSEKKEELEMIAENNSYIKEAYTQLENMSLDEKKREEYETRQKTLRDLNTMKEEALEEGRKEGIEQGLEKGMEQGLEKGLEQGISQVAKNMLNLGMEVDFISESTGLSIDQILTLKADC